MKNQKFINLAAIAIAVIGISISGCKKDKIEKEDTVATESLTQLSNDDNQLQNASDEALDDVSAFASRTTSKSADDNKSIMALPCNVTITDSTSTADSTKITLTFNGNNCANTRFRTGQIEYSKKISENWKDAGTTIVAKFINFKVTKIATNKSIVINGTKRFQNVSGGVLPNLGTSVSSIVHKVSGSLLVTFDDNSTRTWNVARQRTYTGSPSQLVLNTDGFGSADGYNNLAAWGINRQGELFYTQITQSIVHKQACGWDPSSGIIIHQIPSFDKKATVTFGFDDNNVAITGNNCPTRYQLVWERNGNSGTIYKPV